MGEKGKSIDGLMRHIRNNHNVSIKGSNDKQNLLNMGYYHGYKASMYIKERKNMQKFKDFNEVKAVYDFDIEMKTIFYPMLVKIETSLKNRLIDFLVKDDQCDLEYIYKTKLRDYASKEVGSKKYKKYLARNLKLREKIDETIAYNYGKGHPAVQHFFHCNKPLPLWAYFEIITFGEFGNFVACLNKEYRIMFTSGLELHHRGLNQNGRILENIIFCLTGLRNATMHNSVVFDCRFNDSSTSNQVKQYLEQVTDIKNISFETLTDFIILLVALLKRVRISKTELNRYVSDFDKSREKLFNSVPFSTYTAIMGTDAKNKISSLKQFIKNN
ncbi:Abi family protein [Enterococcus faecalis]|nr:Abi family protein [Enterococcus faecalis]